MRGSGSRSGSGSGVGHSRAGSGSAWPQEGVLTRFAGARVAVLGTIDHERGARAAPHLVPVTFAMDLDRLDPGAEPAERGPAAPRVLTAVDAKPKKGPALRRLRNIAANPAVSLLVQSWSEDWAALWWVRADGTAEISDDAAVLDRARALLAAKYRQYGSVAVTGPVVVVTVEAWRAWSPVSEPEIYGR